MSKIIPPLDLMWLLMETPTTPTHIGGLLLFQRPAGRPSLVREIVEAYRSYEPVPPFNYLPKLGLRVPRFVESAHIDHVYHVQHLAMPAGSTYEDFLRLVTDLHEPMLDHGRPLFRMWIIEGLPDRQFAIYVKMNHSDQATAVRRHDRATQAAPIAAAGRAAGAYGNDRHPAGRGVEGRIVERAPQDTVRVGRHRSRRQPCLHGPALANERAAARGALARHAVAAAR